MIILDTNVLSELMRSQPDHTVLAWAAREPLTTLFTTSISKAEILYGVELLPEGRRRTILAEAAQRMLTEAFADRILPFDAGAASYYAAIAASRRRAGRPIDVPDAQIAAIALAVGAAVATRDVDGFESCGVTLVNPWTAA
jgi:predicted nucleic acid-binding protein